MRLRLQQQQSNLRPRRCQRGGERRARCHDLPSQNYLRRGREENVGKLRYTAKEERERERRHASRVIANEEVLGGGVSGNLGVARRGWTTYFQVTNGNSILAQSLCPSPKVPLVQIKGHTLNGQIGEHIRCHRTIANPVSRTLSNVSNSALCAELLGVWPGRRMNCSYTQDI